MRAFDLGRLPASIVTDWAAPLLDGDLQTMLDAGEATRGLTVTARGGHLIVGRTDEYGAEPRFCLSPLGGGAYGLSLYRRKRWEPLPF